MGRPVAQMGPESVVVRVPAWLAGSLAGAATLAPAQAAEWLAAPTLSWVTDYSSNRYLSPQPLAGEGALVQLAAVLKWSAPTLQLTASPSYALQRYTQGSAADADNQAINLAAAYEQERAKWNFTASASELSTLTTELTTTGVVQGNTRQRAKSGGAELQFQQSEGDRLDVNLSYSDVDYVGDSAQLLPGYRYPNASASERIALSDVTAVTVTALGGLLQSGTPRAGGASAGNTQNEQVSFGLEHTFTERITGTLSLGGSRQSFTGGSRLGEIANASLTRSGDVNVWNLVYSRSVVPSGFGVFFQTDQAVASVTRTLAPRFTCSLSISGIRNSNIGSTPFADRRTYASGVAGLNWQSSETTSVALSLGADHASSSNVVIGSASNWHIGVNFTWVPQPSTLSR